MSTLTKQKEIGGVHFVIIIIIAQVHKHIPRLSLFLGNNIISNSSEL